MANDRLDNKGVLTTCSSCGQRNRIPFLRLATPRPGASRVQCGKCHSALASPAAPIETPDAPAFDAAITQSDVPVVVDFWAPWCGPCRMVGPELEKVAARHAGEYLVLKVNTDAIPELGERFRVRSIPTMAVFGGGAEVGRTAGARPAADIEAFIESTLARR